jgi:hypothetical protein
VLAVTHYLATKPTGGVLICLVVAIVCFVFAAILSFPLRAWPYVMHLILGLLAVGLAFFMLAFLV